MRKKEYMLAAKILGGDTSVGLRESITFLIMVAKRLAEITDNKKNADGIYTSLTLTEKGKMAFMKEWRF